jgi:hypothetical protein
LRFDRRRLLLPRPQQQQHSAQSNFNNFPILAGFGILFTPEHGGTSYDIIITG